MKRYKSKSKIGRPYGAITITNHGAKTEYRKGTYTFKYGTVLIYAEPTIATFSFVFNGEDHNLCFSNLEAPLTDRQLILHAGRFAREVVYDARLDSVLAIKKQRGVAGSNPAGGA